MSQSTARIAREYLRETDKMIFKEGKITKASRDLYQLTKSELAVMPAKIRGKILGEMKGEIIKERNERLDSRIETWKAIEGERMPLHAWLGVTLKALKAYQASHGMSLLKRYGYPE